MGRYRRCAGTNELVRLDLRDRQLRELLRRIAAKPLESADLLADGVRLRLVSTPARFGGRRHWFYCLGCGHCRLALYRHPQQSDYWRCRECLHLTYRSQRASRDLSLTGQFRVEALYRRYYPDWRYCNNAPPKPARVRWRTWKRVQERVAYWESQRDAHFLARIGELLWRDTTGRHHRPD